MSVPSPEPVPQPTTPSAPPPAVAPPAAPGGQLPPAPPLAPPPAPGGYAQPGFPGGAPPAGASSPLPVLSVVFGVAGLLFGLLLAVPAIIMGALGRKKCKEQGTSTATATVGIVLGAVGTALWLVMGVLFAVLFMAAGMQSVVPVPSDGPSVVDDFGADVVTSPAGQATADAVADANMFFADNGSYTGWQSPAPTTSVVLAGGLTVCVQAEGADGPVRTVGMVGQTVPPDAANPGQAWEAAPCPIDG